MRTLVVGQGSIGQRHARVLRSLGCAVAVVSRSAAPGPRVYAGLAAAIEAWRPGYVVIANRTDEHRATLDTLIEAGFDGRVLVEKPLFADDEPPARHRFSILAVGYNLRFHPVLQRLRSILAGTTRINTATIYVGSYLPDWRPGADYRESYSAARSQGGGVLRDLSHELDYAAWLFGAWHRLTAFGGHLSALEIDSDDAYTLLMETERCPLVSIHLNYLDRVAHRSLVVNADEKTYVGDLVNGTLETNGFSESLATERDALYSAEHSAMLAGETGSLCTQSDAAATLSTIVTAERAAREHCWVTR